MESTADNKEDNNKAQQNVSTDAAKEQEEEDSVIIVEALDEGERIYSHRNSIMTSPARARITRKEAKLERLRLLIQHLVSTERADVVYRNSFFLMLHYFSTPQVIFDLLISHLKQPPMAYDADGETSGTKLQRSKIKELSVLQVSSTPHRSL